MNIEEVLEKLKKEFPDCKFEQNEKFDCIEDDGTKAEYRVAFTIRKENTFVMAIQEAKGEEEEKGVYCNYVHYGITPYYSVVLVDDRFFCSERNFRVESPNRDKGKINFSLRQIEFQEPTEISYEQLVDIIRSFVPDHYKRIYKNQIEQFFGGHAESHDVDISVFLSSIDEKDMEFDNRECWLERKAEVRLMSSLLNGGELPSILYRYTSSDTLYRIFASEEKTKFHHSLSSLITMNDVTEIDYANRYLSKKNVDAINATFDEDCENSTHTFITSLSDKEDDLTMWRLYGNNAKGICLVYDYNNEEFDFPYFMLARVSYANGDEKDNKLDFVAELMQASIGGRKFRLNNWHIWQHFFKPCEYRIESEVRLLVFADELETLLAKYEKKWITTSDNIFAPILLLPLKSEEKQCYPLTIRRILLGSKFPEKEMNRIAWERKIKDECNGLVSMEFSIECSKIDSYR